MKYLKRTKRKVWWNKYGYFFWMPIGGIIGALIFYFGAMFLKKNYDVTETQLIVLGAFCIWEGIFVAAFIWDLHVNKKKSKEQARRERQEELKDVARLRFEEGEFFTQINNHKNEV